MLSDFLCKQKLTPEALPAVEALRYKNVMKYQAHIRGPWRSVFDRIPKGGEYFGYHNDEMISFNYDGYGIAYSPLQEGSTNANKFVRCLEEELLPLYINSKFEEVRNAAANRLKGTKGYEPIPRRQDIVHDYYKADRRGQRLLKVIEFCDMVILEHFKSLLNKVDKKYRHEKPMLTLAINDRVYVYLDGKLLIKPESRNWIFQVSDIGTEGVVPVPELYKTKMHITIVKEDDDASTR